MDGSFRSALPQILIPLTGPDWEIGDPVRVHLRGGLGTSGVSSDLFRSYGLSDNGDGTFRMSALVREWTPPLFSGPIAPALRAAGLNVAESVIVVSPLTEADRNFLFANEYAPGRRVAKFVIYMGLVLAAFGLFGRRKAVLPPVR